MSDECFKLKGTNLTVFVLVLDHNVDKNIFDQLTHKVEQAPHFFTDSPIVIDLLNIDSNTELNLNELVSHCQSIGLKPIGFKNLPDSVDVTSLALPVLPTTGKIRDAHGKKNNIEDDIASADSEEDKKQPGSQDSETRNVDEGGGPSPDAETIIEERLVTRPSKVITRPVRSGQQVYAEGVDLIVLNQVSEGAEVIADGNIHIYGALRGRAIAGARGDAGARIFCQQMNAELVSIAGNFLLSDDMQKDFAKQAVQIHLEGESLRLEKL